MNALFYVNIDQVIHKGKSMKNEKKLYGFSHTLDTSNLEAFRWNISKELWKILF